MTPEETVRVLVVDDEEAIRNFVATVLRRNGYSVLQAADGQKAIDLFYKEPEQIGFLLTDMAMPHKNGIELIHALRATNQELPVLLMSGNIQWDEELEGIPFLAKPFTTGTLLRAVERALQDAEEAREFPAVCASACWSPRP